MFSQETTPKNLKKSENFSKLEHLVHLKLVLTPLNEGYITNQFPARFKKEIINIANQYVGKINEEDLSFLFISFLKKNEKYLFSKKIKIEKGKTYAVEIKYSSKLLNKFFVEHFILDKKELKINIEQIEFRLKKIEFSKPLNKINIFDKIISTTSKIQVHVDFKTPTISPFLQKGSIFTLQQLMEEPAKLLSFYLFPDEANEAYKEIMTYLGKSKIRAIRLNSIIINDKLGIYGKIIYVVDSFSLLSSLLILLEYMGYGDEKDSGCGMLNIAIRPHFTPSEKDLEFL